EGVGSCFGISLPMPVAEERDLPALPEGLRRALVVMEDGLDRTILERRLIALGLEVTCAETGAAGGDADVVFIDASGADAVAALAAHHPATPIIVVIQSDRPAPDAGEAAAVLRRPIARRDLVEVLAALDPGATSAAPDPKPAVVSNNP